MFTRFATQVVYGDFNCFTGSVDTGNAGDSSVHHVCEISPRTGS